MGRERLETGTAGSVGTGDTIHNGGNKLRDNSDEFYHINADFELTGAGETYIPVFGDVLPRPHAGGYWNRIPASATAGGSGGPNPTNLQTSIVMGGKYDIDTSSAGGGAITSFNLPLIGTSAGQAKRGEVISFKNTTASFSANPIRLVSNAGQAIVGASELDGSHIIKDDRVIIECIVIDDGTGIAGTEQWGIKITPLLGEFGAPVDENIGPIVETTTTSIRLFDISSYDAVKLMVYAQNSAVGAGGNVTRRMTSEILLLNNQTNAYIDEYSVINTDSDFGDIVSLVPRIDGDDIMLDITALDENISVTIKSIETIRLS